MRATTLTGGQIADGVLIAAAVRVVLTTTAYWLVLLLFGAVSWTTAVPLIAVSTFAGMCWAAVMLAVTANVMNEDGFLAFTWRLVIMPMFLFSGTFYPLSSLPLALQWIGWISPLWHATQLGRWLSYGMPLHTWQVALSMAYLLALGIVGMVLARRRFERRLTACTPRSSLPRRPSRSRPHGVSTQPPAGPPARRPPPGRGGARAGRGAGAGGGPGGRGPGGGAVAAARGGGGGAGLAGAWTPVSGSERQVHAGGKGWCQLPPQPRRTSSSPSRQPSKPWS